MVEEVYCRCEGKNSQRWRHLGEWSYCPELGQGRKWEEKGRTVRPRDQEVKE